MLDYQGHDMDRDYQLGARTDQNGRYQISSLQAGKYDVWAESPDWLNSGVGEVNVPPGQSVELEDLQLIRGAQSVLN